MFARPLQNEVEVSLTHQLENRYETLFPIVLESRRENHAKVARTHWLNAVNSVHMAMISLLESLI